MQIVFYLVYVIGAPIDSIPKESWNRSPVMMPISENNHKWWQKYYSYSHVLSISDNSTNGIEEPGDYLLFCIKKAGNNES